MHVGSCQDTIDEQSCDAKWSDSERHNDKIDRRIQECKVDDPHNFSDDFQENEKFWKQVSRDTRIMFQVWEKWFQVCFEWKKNIPSLIVSIRLDRREAKL